MSDLGARELTSREGGGHTSWPADPLLRETIDLRSGLLNPLVKVLRSPVKTMNVFNFFVSHSFATYMLLVFLN
jgi:hypothetical protein